MLIDGEKYACEACIRGHRVSSCNHSERELVHVARKGRPISQCQHCRGQRKARAQHVNCQCGANAHDKEHCTNHDGNKDGGCCCSHTSKCTCAIKKDKNAQIVHDDGIQPLHPRESPKPMGHIKNCHDNKPMVFTGNGHHKPAHKFNDAHNQLGSPYKIPSRASSVHHHQSLAQRSTDSLPLTKFARPHHESPLHHSLTPRQIKSEHNSPMIRPTNVPNAIPNDLLLPEYDPNAYSYSPFSSNNSAVPDTSQNNMNIANPFIDGFGMPVSQPEDLQAQNVDWNSYDFSAFGGNANNNPYINDPNFLGNPNLPLAGEQFGNLNLGMTPSSGDVTDVDEFGFSRNDQPRSQSGDASTGVSSPENSQMDRYRQSVEGTPVLQNNVLNNDDGLDIDDYLRQAEYETKRLSIQNQMRQMNLLQQALSQNNSQESLLQQSQTPSQSQTPLRGSEFNAGMHPFTVHEAQERAHSADATPAPEFAGLKQNVALPTSSLAMDPSWSAPPDMSNPTLSLDDAQEDEDWVR